MSRLIVRTASREDIAAFTEDENRPTLRAWCADLDGRIIALGGVAIVKGRYIGFVDLLDEMRPYRMHIMRSAIRFLDQARRDGIRYIYADADLREKNSVAWLTRLGFERDPRSRFLYRWKASKDGWASSFGDDNR